MWQNWGKKLKIILAECSYSILSVVSGRGCRILKLGYFLTVTRTGSIISLTLELELIDGLFGHLFFIL